MINAELYKIFYYTALSGSISEAARKLYVSQPAVSKSIQKLENLTGCTLFERFSRGIKLTTEGRILFDYVENAFDTLENGEKIMEKLKQKTDGLVRVGISNTLCKYFFLPHLEAFHYVYPGIRIQVINRTSPETLKLLEQGQLDFGIISIPIDRGELDYIELMGIQDIFVAGKKYTPGKESLPIEKLTEYPLLMLEEGNLSRLCIDRYFKSQNIDITPEIEISSMDLLIEFAKIGLGVASAIKEFVADELVSGDLFEFPIFPAIPPCKIGIALMKNIPVSIASRTFIDFLKQRSL